ncbi:hypothetical protein [Pseudochrobactrum sp. MP213Fo]|uniref:hypothetical protein n=1 Tax=Pseudochrobactrum sp. MP213Fo TaxID=3022250 RepID=UPI003BA3492F
MKRFILAIAALGMIAPVAAQAAPVQNGSAVQAHQPAVNKVSAHKTTSAATLHKGAKQTVKKAPVKQVKK